MESLNKILIIPDTHVPYHDTRAFEIMLKVGKAFRPDITIILGDFADFYSVSSHSKSPNREKSLAAEVKAVNKALDKIDELGSKNKYFIEGNHEYRLERYLQDKAPELFDSVNVPELFKLHSRGWHWTPYKKHVKVGKMYFTHDTGFAGRDACIRSAAMFEHSTCIGHTHTALAYYFGNAIGENHVAFSCGWLGDRAAIDYLHSIKVHKDWQLGFGVAYMEKCGTVHARNLPIVNYKCVFDGKIYTA